MMADSRRSLPAGRRSPRPRVRHRERSRSPSSRTSIASLEITPGSAAARTGDVLRFSVTAKDAQGRTIDGLTPTWSFSPGQGTIEQDGAFVGYEARRVHRDCVVRQSRRVEATVSLDASRRASPGDRRRTTAALALQHRRSLGPPGRQARLPRLRRRRRRHVRDRHQRSGQPRRHRFGDREHAARERRHDDRPTASFSSSRARARAIARTASSSARSRIRRTRRSIAEFTDGVTGGVHSAFVYKQEKFGTHIYLTNDGTGALHILDINDPYHPKEVAQWKTEGVPTPAARCTTSTCRTACSTRATGTTASSMLDIGNGMKGGSPSNPTDRVAVQVRSERSVSSRSKLDGGPGFIRGTHTAWRHKNYVFIADEVFPASGVKGAKDAAAGPRVRPSAGARRERHRASEVGRVVRAGVRRRAQRVGRRRHALHGRVQRRLPRVRHLR